LPDSTELAGPQAWTPDGRFLVTVHTGPGESSYVFQPVDASETSVPQPIPAGNLLPRAWGDAVLGWRTPTKMLVSAGDVNGTTSNLIVEVDIAGGAQRVLSRFRVGANDDLAVGDVQLASALLPEMGKRSGDSPNRGPMPTWMMVTLVLSFVPATLTVLLGRWRRSRRRDAAPSS
jgi:hypothetical protein